MNLFMFTYLKEDQTLMQQSFGLLNLEDVCWLVTEVILAVMILINWLMLLRRNTIWFVKAGWNTLMQNKFSFIYNQMVLNQNYIL